MVELGIARGFIELVVDRFQKSADVIKRTSRQVGDEVEKIGGSADKAAKATETAMTRAAKSIAGVRTQILALTVAAGALTGMGVKAAQDVKTLTTSITLLAGSQKASQKILDDTRKLADEFNSPYLDLLSSARAFLPLAKQNNIEMNQLQKLALKIKAVAPQKSFDEIKFSVSEALSGDFVSIKDAIDLSKKQRDELKKAFDENGPQAVLEGISKILEARGFDDEMLKEFGESGANAFAILRSEVQETLAVAFLPLLNDVVLPLVKEFGNFIRGLRDTNPELLKVGAAVVAIVALGAPLIGFLSQAVVLWNALGMSAAKAGGMMSGAMKVVGKVAGVGLAVAGGVELGKAGATALANAGVGGKGSDLERIRKGEDAGDILKERLTQGVGILLGVLAEAAKQIAITIDLIVKAFQADQIGLLVRNYVEMAMLAFQSSMLDFVIKLEAALHQAAPQIFKKEEKGLSRKNADGTVTDFGSGTAAERAKKSVDDQIAARMRENVSIINMVQTQADRDKISAGIDSQLRGLYESLGLIPKKVEEVAEDIEDATGSIKPPVDTAEYIEKQNQEIADSVKQYNDDITSMDADRLQSLSEANQQFADDQVRIAQEAAQASKDALADLIEDRNKLNTDYIRDGEKAERDRQSNIRDAHIKAARQEVEDTQQHAEKLAKMRDDQRRDEEKALMNLDFAKLFELTTDNAGVMAGENTEFAAQREARNTALQYELEDMQTAFNDERAERLIKFNQDLSDRSVQYQKELEQIRTQAVEKQAQLAATHAAELVQIQNKYNAELQIRQSAMQKELQFLMQTEAQRAQILANTQNQLLAQAAQLASRYGMKTSAGVQQASARQSVQNVVDTVRNSPVGSTLQNIGNTISNVAGNVGNTLSNLMNGLQGRAGGGPLAAGQSAMVNEPWSSGKEGWQTGGRSYALPGQTGIFTPFQSGNVDANRKGGGGGSVVINNHFHAPIDSGILTIDQALAMIDTATEAKKLQLLQEING